jgi:hypothetical protein
MVGSRATHISSRFVGLLEEPSYLGITSILFSCLTGDALQMTPSLFRGGSHLAHHHHIIIPQWLPQSNMQHGQMD